MSILAIVLLIACWCAAIGVFTYAIIVNWSRRRKQSFNPDVERQRLIFEARMIFPERETLVEQLDGLYQVYFTRSVLARKDDNQKVFASNRRVLIMIYNLKCEEIEYQIELYGLENQPMIKYNRPPIPFYRGSKS